MWTTVMVLALGAAGISTPQAAPSPPATPEQADARCLAAFAAMADKATGPDANADVGEAGKVGVLYFVGKLRGRNPTIDLEGALRGALPALQADPKGEVTRCSGELSDVGAALSTAGDALQKAP